MKGRKPKPTKLKLAHGTARKCRLNESEPQIAVAVPACPAHLSGVAKRKFREVAKELAAAGILTLLDQGILASYCQAWARWVKAEKKLADESEVIKSAVGGPYQNPWLAVSNRAVEQMAKFGASLGLDPSSRSRLETLPPAEEADPLLKYTRKA